MGEVTGEGKQPGTAQFVGGMFYVCFDEQVFRIFKKGNSLKNTVSSSF